MSGDDVVSKTFDSVDSSGKMWENWNFSQGFGRRRVLGIYNIRSRLRTKGSNLRRGCIDRTILAVKAEVFCCPARTRPREQKSLSQGQHSSVSFVPRRRSLRTYLLYLMRIWSGVCIGINV